MSKDLLFPLRRLHGWIYETRISLFNKIKIRRFKNKYKGKRCFIIGNGPSLTSQDLTILHNNKEYTFATNRIYLMFSKTNWRPTFYVCEDINVANGYKNEIQSIDANNIFIPYEMNSVFHVGINVPNAILFHMNYDPEKRMPFGFSSNISKQIECRGTVTCTCMQIAAYMGFSEIYLLGVDHNYHKTIDIDGNVIIDPNAKDYFCDNYDTAIQDLVAHNMGDNTRAYLDARKYCETTKETTIYNATRGGKLEVFRRVNFEDLFFL